MVRYAGGMGGVGWTWGLGMGMDDGWVGYGGMCDLCGDAQISRTCFFVFTSINTPCAVIAPYASHNFAFQLIQSIP